MVTTESSKESLPARSAPEATGIERWALTFRVEGDVRFISHRDTIRLFQRALARASLPVRYTQGFNPHPCLSFPLPRPVGMASEAETVVVAFERSMDAEDLVRALARQLPDGVAVMGARRLALRERLRPVCARYRLEPERLPDGEDIALRVDSILESSILPITRIHRHSKRQRRLDARPGIVALRVDGDAVEFVLRITDGGMIRPAEVAGLLGFDVDSINHRIRLLDTQWQSDFR